MGEPKNNYPGAPSCPPWCGCHAEGDGWDVHPAAITKTCRRVVQCDGGAEIIVERFATITDGRVQTRAVELLVWCVDALTVEQSITLSHTLRRVAELIHEPVAA